MQEMAPYKVCVVTGTRAEYGLLRRVLFLLRDCEVIDLHLFITGSHLSDAFGNTESEIVEDGFSDYERVVLPIDDDSKPGMAIATGIATQEFGQIFKNYHPDLMVVLGDRYEIMGVVTASFLSGIPVAHISGGDVTEGAVDDAIRHCLTKMSVLHFPGCEESAKRIIQLGENPNRVFNVGDLGVENCLKMDLMTKEQLVENLCFPGILSDYSVVTFHPVTMEKDTSEKQLYELIEAMDSLSQMTYIVTLSNADAGGRLINNIWQKEGEKHSNWLVVSSLGAIRYLSAVKYAKMVIGNSSSGVIEAPSLRTPTVNIGDRQKGRMIAESVICCKPQKDQIIDAMNKAMTPDFHKIIQNMEFPFGKGDTSKKILDYILEYLSCNNQNNKKTFFDIDF